MCTMRNNALSARISFTNRIRATGGKCIYRSLTMSPQLGVQYNIRIKTPRKGFEPLCLRRQTDQKSDAFNLALPPRPRICHFGAIASKFLNTSSDIIYIEVGFCEDNPNLGEELFIRLFSQDFNFFRSHDPS